MESNDFNKRYTKARTKAIEQDFMHLNESQREAVLTTNGPLLLLAGAGSGKTTVLINRIANILKYGCGSDSDYVPQDVTEEDLSQLESHINSPLPSDLDSGTKSRHNSYPLAKLQVTPTEPWRVIAITFTNKAAGELKDRLCRMLGSNAEDIWASTFHSACVRILRRDIDKMGYSSAFAIYDTADSASLMKRIMKDMDVDERVFPHRMVLGYISRAKDEMISASEFLSSAEKSGDIRRRIIAHAYTEYENRMRNSNSLDFDDLILVTVQLFKKHPDVLEYYQKRFKYIFVDEYQDTNNLQYILVSSLAGAHSNICVVGDDDQSIYKFRGATIENILSFEKHFKDARVIRLEQNYRSTGHILDAANDVISNNKGRKGKKLWTNNGRGELPELHITSDERVEAQLVSDTIVASAASGKSWREHAVLYRMNAQSNQFETAFKRSAIPYRIFGGTGFYERAEIKDMLAYLCLIHNPDDDVRLLRVINNPPRGIGSTTISKLTELASELELPVFELIRQSQNHQSLLASAGRLQKFVHMVEQLRELAKNAPLDELYDAVILETGYVQMLEQKNPEENISRIENVMELKTNIISFMNENGGTLFDFLSETALFTDLDRDDQDTDRVVLMTMHSAKGLEFDTVFVVGAEEGVFPGMRAIGEPAEMEEERRLCYVAMTRAMRKLYFTCAQRRMLFGKTTAAMPSRFVREIKSDNIEVFDDRQSAFGGFTFDYTGGFSSQSSKTNTTYNANVHDSSHYDRKSKTQDYMKTTPNYKTGTTAAGHHISYDFKKGDIVDHSAFGRGVIKESSPAGGDALLEIDFEDTGKRRMLLKSAARYMTKVELS